MSWAHHIRTLRAPSRRGLGGVLGLFLSATCLSCAEPPPFEIRYETEHLRIGTEFDYPLCAGDLASFDAQIDGLEELLSIEVSEPITLYLWEGPPEEYCDGGARGCFLSESKTIHSAFSALDHEFVHAVVYEFAEPPAFFDEGAAEALRRGRLVSVQAPHPLANFERDGDEVSYNSAGLFMRWLWERYGAEPFLAILKEQRPPLEAFEAVYGMTPEAAEAMFFDELPYSYPPLIDCEHPQLPQVEDSSWSESLELDCARDDVHGGDGVNGVLRQFTVTQAGSYAVDFAGEKVWISRCADQILETAPEDGDPAWGDVPPTNSIMRAGFFRLIDDDGPDVLELVPGRYELSLVGEPGSTVSLSVEATASDP